MSFGEFRVDKAVATDNTLQPLLVALCLSFGDLLNRLIIVRLAELNYQQHLEFRAKEGCYDWEHCGTPADGALSLALANNSTGRFSSADQTQLTNNTVWVLVRVGGIRFVQIGLFLLATLFHPYWWRSLELRRTIPQPLTTVFSFSNSTRYTDNVYNTAYSSPGPDRSLAFFHRGSKTADKKEKRLAGPLFRQKHDARCEARNNVTVQQLSVWRPAGPTMAMKSSMSADWQRCCWWHLDALRMCGPSSYVTLTTTERLQEFVRTPQLYLLYYKNGTVSVWHWITHTLVDGFNWNFAESWLIIIVTLNGPQLHVNCPLTVKFKGGEFQLFITWIQDDFENRPPFSNNIAANFKAYYRNPLHFTKKCNKLFRCSNYLKYLISFRRVHIQSKLKSPLKIRQFPKTTSFIA